MNQYKVRLYDPDVADFTVRANTLDTAAKLAAVRMYPDRKVTGAMAHGSNGYYIAHDDDGQQVGRLFHVSQSR